MFDLLFNGFMLGIGLAMDAFSMSLANGLAEPRMKPGKMCGIAGIFAFFQALMPMIGWLCIHTVAQYFEAFETLIPWIALALLGYIGGKMLYEGIKNKGEEGETPTLVNNLDDEQKTMFENAIAEQELSAEDEQIADVPVSYSW